MEWNGMEWKLPDIMEYIGAVYRYYALAFSVHVEIVRTNARIYSPWGIWEWREAICQEVINNQRNKLSAVCTAQHTVQSTLIALCIHSAAMKCIIYHVLTNHRELKAKAKVNIEWKSWVMLMVMLMVMHHGRVKHHINTALVAMIWLI